MILPTAWLAHALVAQGPAAAGSPVPPADNAPPPHQASFQVRASSPVHARALCAALQVEANDPLGGARVHLEMHPQERAVFTIQIHAVDVVHLRAATNSFLKWLKAADASLDAAAEAGR